ncbi:MAG: hypothetical protein WC002_09375, partial [Candidatus Muiribacteriota bacterium]
FVMVLFFSLLSSGFDLQFQNCINDQDLINFISNSVKEITLEFLVSRNILENEETLNHLLNNYNDCHILFDKTTIFIFLNFDEVYEVTDSELMLSVQEELQEILLENRLTPLDYVLITVCAYVIDHYETKIVSKIINGVEEKIFEVVPVYYEKCEKLLVHVDEYELPPAYGGVALPGNPGHTPETPIIIPPQYRKINSIKK